MRRAFLRCFIALLSLLFIKHQLFAGSTQTTLPSAQTQNSKKDNDCGTSESADCNEERTVDGFRWRLDSRINGIEIWRDETSGLSFSHVLPKMKKWIELIMELETGRGQKSYVEMESSYCKSQDEETLNAKGYRTDLS